MTQRDILDQDNLQLPLPLLGVAVVWTYMGAVVASLGDPPAALIAGALVAAAILYQLTARTEVDLGYLPVGAAGLAVSAAGLCFTNLSALFLFATVLSGSLFCLPIAILAQTRAAPKVPGWVANLGAGLACLCAISAALIARDRLAEWPLLSSISLVGIPVFAALAVFSFYHLIGHVLLRLVRPALRAVYRIEFEGVDHIPTDGGFLACSNHVSYIDFLLMGASLERPYRFVGDHAYVSGAFRWFFIGAGGITIASAREDAKILADALRKIPEALARGHAVGLHPEGFMTRTGYLQPIRPGVEMIVARSNVPVVPVFIDGMYGSFLSRKYGRRLGKGDWSFRRRVVVRFGKPIPAEGFSKELLEERLVEAGAARESDHGVESRSKHKRQAV